MNKKGLIGKILLILVGIILVLGVIVGITAYQIYGLVKTVQTEQVNIQADINAMSKGDCSKIPDLEVSISKIKDSAINACANPIINYAVERMQQIQIKCKDLSALDAQVQSNLAGIKGACANLTLVSA